MRMKIEDLPLFTVLSTNEAEQITSRPGSPGRENLIEPAPITWRDELLKFLLLTW